MPFEKASETVLEHWADTTCDPVPLPCINRHSLCAQSVSLDAALKTIVQTETDMSETYNKTAPDGLAVTVVDC